MNTSAARGEEQKLRHPIRSSSSGTMKPGMLTCLPSIAKPRPSLRTKGILKFKVWRRSLTSRDRGRRTLNCAFNKVAPAPVRS